MNNLWISLKMANHSQKGKLNKLIQSFGQLKDDDFDFEKIERYFKNKMRNESFQVLSDKTCRDLDFEDLFTFLDRTNSAVGQQFLYNRLRNLPKDSTHLKSEEKLIEQILKSPDLRTFIQKQLYKLNEEEAHYIQSIFQEKPIKPPKWLSITPFLAFASLLSILGILINPAFLILFILLFITNLVLHYMNKKNVFIYLTLLPELIKMSRIARALYKNNFLKEINPGLDKALKSVRSIGFSLTFFDMGSRVESDYTAILYWFYSQIKIIFLLEPLMLFNLLKKLWKKKDDIEEIYSFVGEIDVLISIASLRKGLEKYCFPQILEQGTSLSAKGAYHPLIENCIPNSIKVDKRSVLITGSNMSGKTTFIRTIAINAITAMTLNTCFADQVTMPRMKIYSAIRISDDLINDKSYYFEEVLTIKDMIAESQKGTPCIFFLDEIFKGTNTVERVSAGKSVLSWLNKGGNIVFVSTHDMELTELLHEEYRLYHFSEQVDDKNVDFDYKLKPGKNHNRNAIRILEINGYPESVVQEAVDISRIFDEARPDFRNNTPETKISRQDNPPGNLSQSS